MSTKNDTTPGSNPPSPVEEARALLAKATPGPWVSGWAEHNADRPVPEAWLIWSEDPDAGAVVASGWWDGPHVACLEPDAALIAAAPRLLAALVEEVERARASEAEAIAHADRTLTAARHDHERQEGNKTSLRRAFSASEARLGEALALLDEAADALPNGPLARQIVKFAQGAR